jgi:hypothetical protein
LAASSAPPRSEGRHFGEARTWPAEEDGAGGAALMPAIKVSACINQRPPDIHAVPAAPAHRLSGPLARGGGDAAAAGRRFDHGAARQDSRRYFWRRPNRPPRPTPSLKPIVRFCPSVSAFQARRRARCRRLYAAPYRRVSTEVLLDRAPPSILDRGAPLDDACDRDRPSIGRLLEDSSDQRAR